MSYFSSIILVPTLYIYIYIYMCVYVCTHIICLVAFKCSFEIVSNVKCIRWIQTRNIFYFFSTGLRAQWIWCSLKWYNMHMGRAGMEIEYIPPYQSTKAWARWVWVCVCVGGLLLSSTLQQCKSTAWESSGKCTALLR